MNLIKKFMSLILATAMMVTVVTSSVYASMPAPLDNPKGKNSFGRYLSTGDFFQAYLSGVETQAKALEWTWEFLTVDRMQLYKLICRPSYCSGSRRNNYPAWTDRNYARSCTKSGRCRNKSRGIQMKTQKAPQIEQSIIC